MRLPEAMNYPVNPINGRRGRYAREDMRGLIRRGDKVYMEYDGKIISGRIMRQQPYDIYYVVMCSDHKRRLFLKEELFGSPEDVVKTSREELMFGKDESSYPDKDDNDNDDGKDWQDESES